MPINEEAQQSSTCLLCHKPHILDLQVIPIRTLLTAYVTGDPYSDHPSATRECVLSAPAHILGICDLLHVDTLNTIRIFPQLVDIKRQTNTLDLNGIEISTYPQ